LDEKSDPCSYLFIIEAGLPDAKHIRDILIEPIHIRLRDGDNERYNHLEIISENGITVVEFHPGLSPDVLEGLHTA